MDRTRSLAPGLLGLALIAGCGVPAALAQQETPAAASTDASPIPGPTGAVGEAAVPVRPAPPGDVGVGTGINRASLLRTLTRINPVLWLLGVCSIVTLGYALERLVALRRERVIPREFVNRFLERLSSGKLDRDRAAELCRANDSPVARVFAMIVSYWGQPAASIRQAVSYDAAGELVDSKRNVRVLNGTATLAPLLGLLGTVIGMIQSFDSLGGRVGSAKGELLAQGISLALVATAVGLCIAIVSVAAYYYLLNRVDVLVRALDEQARQVIDLVSSEALRPPPSPRPAHLGDHPRHETRIH